MELKDTVDMMCSDKYEEMFIAEYYQLKLRIENLNRLLIECKENKSYDGINFKYNLLNKQLSYMQKYAITMEARAISENIDVDKYFK